MVGAYFGSGKDLQDSFNAMYAAGMISSGGYVNHYTGLSQALGGTAALYATSLNANNLTAINQQLAAGYPVMVWFYVENGANTHWVVLTGQDGSTYYCNDPNGGLQTTLSSTSFGNISPSAIQGYVVYHGTPVASWPPAERIVCPGLRLGVDLRHRRRCAPLRQQLGRGRRLQAVHGDISGTVQLAPLGPG